MSDTEIIAALPQDLRDILVLFGDRVESVHVETRNEALHLVRSVFVRLRPASEAHDRQGAA